MSDKNTARAELIASIVTDRFSGFGEPHMAILEAASDEQLNGFRTAAAARQVEAATLVRLETENRNLSARVKVLEEKLRDADSARMSEEYFLEHAPEPFQAILKEHKAAEEQTRTSIIVQLKGLGQHTEDELKKMKTPELLVLAGYAKLSITDYSGRAVAHNRNLADKNAVSYKPTTGWTDAIAAQNKKAS
jgi:hypothetical protein